MQWSIGKGVIEYVNTKEIDALKPVVEQFSQIYAREQSWQFIENNHGDFRRLIASQLKASDFLPSKGRPPAERPYQRPPMRGGEHPQRPNRPSFDGQKPQKGDPSQRRSKVPPVDTDSHYALLDKDKNLIVGGYFEQFQYSKTPIMVDEVIVGYFAISKRNRLTQGYELDFIEQQQHYLWLIALLVMCLVALITLPLARHIVEPIKKITHGMHKLTHGDYQARISIDRQDELAELARDYNELALTLAENESARKRWLANISHELRTPVAILRGELEAMLDGVRALEISNIHSAHDEVKHLQRLIDDLNLLATTDIGGMQYRKASLNLTHLLQGELEKYRSYLADADIYLNLQGLEQNIELYADKTRLCQLFENIINNCVKYSQATVLTINISLASQDNQPQVTMEFYDNGIGVEPHHLNHLFEHLYRVEDSRNRKTGGSGLGLSICRHIVHAHQGEISAKQAESGGLAILITLPVAH